MVLPMASLTLEVGCRIPRFVRLLMRIGMLACAVFIFTSGFLLTRHELERGASVGATAELEGPPRRVILMVIDALRYDFARYDAAYSEDDKTPPYRNKLTVLRDLAARHGCSRTRLFRFEAFS